MWVIESLVSYDWTSKNISKNHQTFGGIYCMPRGLTKTCLIFRIGLIQWLLKQGPKSKTHTHYIMFWVLPKHLFTVKSMKVKTFRSRIVKYNHILSHSVTFLYSQENLRTFKNWNSYSPKTNNKKNILTFYQHLTNLQYNKLRWLFPHNHIVNVSTHKNNTTTTKKKHDIHRHPMENPHWKNLTSSISCCPVKKTKTSPGLAVFHMGIS